MEFDAAHVARHQLQDTPDSVWSLSLNWLVLRACEGTFVFLCFLLLLFFLSFPPTVRSKLQLTLNLTKKIIQLILFLS